MPSWSADSRPKYLTISLLLASTFGGMMHFRKPSLVVDAARQTTAQMTIKDHILGEVRTSSFIGNLQNASAMTGSWPSRPSRIPVNTRIWRVLWKHGGALAEAFNGSGTYSGARRQRGKI